MLRTTLLAFAALVAIGANTARAQQSPAQSPAPAPSQASSENPAEESLKLRGHKLQSRADLYKGDIELVGYEGSADPARAHVQLLQLSQPPAPDEDADEEHRERILALYSGQPIESYPEPAAIEARVPGALGGGVDEPARSGVGFPVYGVMLTVAGLAAFTWRRMHLKAASPNS